MSAIHFEPHRGLGGGKSTWSTARANALLAAGHRVGLGTSRGVFTVPPGYQIAQPIHNDCWSLRTPDGTLVRYRVKR